MRVKIEWLTAEGPAGYLTLGGESIGRLYHEGCGWTMVVRGFRRGGYAQVRDIVRDAKRLWEGRRV